MNNNANLLEEIIKSNPKDNIGNYAIKEKNNINNNSNNNLEEKIKLNNQKKKMRIILITIITMKINILCLQ